jgi:hypothetical protein
MDMTVATQQMRGSLHAAALQQASQPLRGLSISD